MTSIIGSPRPSLVASPDGFGSYGGLALPHSLSRGGHAPGQHEPPGFGAGLQPLGLGIGVGNDSRPHLDRRAVVVADDRPDGDAGVEVPRVRNVANGPAIGAAPRRLQLVDDLHGPDLGRTGERARRKARL